MDRKVNRLLPAFLAALGGTLFGLQGSLRFYLIWDEHAAASSGFGQLLYSNLKEQALAEHQLNTLTFQPNTTRDSLEDECFGLSCSDCLRPGRVGRGPDGTQRPCGWQSVRPSSPSATSRPVWLLRRPSDHVSA